MDILFGVACGLTGIMLFLLGALKTKFTRQKWYIGGGEIFSRIAQARIAQYGVLGWSEDDTNDYEQMLDDTCREMIDEVCDEPTVSLVKKYSKGSFKFV